mmetsp:Transcript_19718/g.54198  ORF Transcript_19718/g.54198 Transcript_19718/m.54198 type:complete len:83 (-) Transcript_19718:185-433(-)
MVLTRSRSTPSSKKANRLKDDRITFDFFIRAMFGGTPPVTQYRPPKQRNLVVKAIMNMIGCGASQRRHDDAADGPGFYGHRA